MTQRPTRRQQQSYIHLPQKDDEEIDDKEDDVRYRDKIGKPPLSSICFALVLVIVGLILETGGLLFLTGYVETEFWRRGFIFVGVGILLLIPGVYVTFIAVNVVLGRKGYTYTMIPE
eukprot:Phypoly_transcript_26867.p1 GENE.Phypoly_transcript_26867~~Phypoly_transcript_26867.p1  ORF type:complete len:117 (+),score=11.91 Phypoly_transcript_26867:80-430(+)